MARWRPPAESSTAIITADGHAQLKSELDTLWRVRRPEVVAALSAAAAEGDRSENAEYQYRKKQLGEIDRRVRYLTKRLPQLKIISALPARLDAVFFGVWVEVERLSDGQVRSHRIVGPDEIDPKRGWISIDSPLARAALGKTVDDEFVAPLPDGPVRFVIVSVRYEDAER